MVEKEPLPTLHQHTAPITAHCKPVPKVHFVFRLIFLILFLNPLPMFQKFQETPPTSLPPLYDETDAEPLLFSPDAPEPGEPDDPTPVSFPPVPPEPLEEAQINAKPFVIELLRLEIKPTGKFRPDSTVQITRALRTSGLLLALLPDELKTLLWVLTFTTPNGTCNPTLSQLASAMNVSVPRAKERMARLLAFRWKEQSILFGMPQESGEVRYAPTPALVAFIERPPLLSFAPAALEPVRAGRESIIAYSRARYARPRAEVEADILRAMGHEPQTPPENPQEREVWETRRTLLALGLTKDQVETLFAKFPFERIRKQLVFLPHRHAKNQIGFLLSAIEGDYEPPLGLRQEGQEFLPLSSVSPSGSTTSPETANVPHVTEE